MIDVKETHVVSGPSGLQSGLVQSDTSENLRRGAVGCVCRAGAPQSLRARRNRWSVFVTG
jgi:hypothetical protein